MRTRIVRIFCQSKCRDMLVVQKWMTREKIDEWGRRHQQIGTYPLPMFAECWDGVRDFELDEYDKAAAFAMDLSMTKKMTFEMAVFEEGEKLSETPQEKSA